MNSPTTINGLSNSRNLPDSELADNFADNCLASVHSASSVVLNTQGTVVTNFDDTGDGGFFIWTVDGQSSTCRFENIGHLTPIHTGPDILGPRYVARSTNETTVDLYYDYPTNPLCGHTDHNFNPSDAGWWSNHSGALVVDSSNCQHAILTIPANPTPGTTYTIHASTRKKLVDRRKVM